MHGTWFVADGEEGPHLHFLVPSGAHATISPAALSCVLYTAAAVLTRYLATQKPECPFMVVTDPEPKYDGRHYIGCIHLHPWPGPGEQYVEGHPECFEEYRGMFAEHAEHFNGDVRHCELVKPFGHEEVNARGSATVN